MVWIGWAALWEIPVTLMGSYGLCVDIAPEICLRHATVVECVLAPRRLPPQHSYDRGTVAKFQYVCTFTTDSPGHYNPTPPPDLVHHRPYHTLILSRLTLFNSYQPLITPLPIHPLIRRVEPAISPQRPLRRIRAHIILRRKLSPPLQALKELPIIDERMPPPVHEEPLRRDQHAATMRMLRRNAIIKATPRKGIIERHDESAHLVVEGHVLHRKAGAGRRGRATVRDALNLDEAREGLLDEIGVALGLGVDVEALDEREAEDGPLDEALLPQDGQAALEAVPEVAVQRAVDAAQRLLIAGVDADVQLRDGRQGRELVRVLGVADEEAGDAFAVQQRGEFVDVRVEDGLADEAEGAVLDLHRFGEALGAHAGHALHHLDFLVVAFFDAVEDQVWWVDLPAPGGADGVGAVAPAEDAFVAAAEGWCRLHAEVRFDAVEGEFVTGSSTPQGGFRPPTDFDARVGADYRVALLCQSGVCR